jgi:hypothetical protein
MFRHMFAILRGSWVPDKLLKQCSVVVEFYDDWPHGTGHNPHAPITQNIAWVAYQAFTTPWWWQPYAETCRGKKIRNLLIKHPLLHWAFFYLFTNCTTRCSVQPSRKFRRIRLSEWPKLVTGNILSIKNLKLRLHFGNLGMFNIRELHWCFEMWSTV